LLAFPFGLFVVVFTPRLPSISTSARQHSAYWLYSFSRSAQPEGYGLPPPFQWFSVAFTIQVPFCTVLSLRVRVGQVLRIDLSLESLARMFQKFVSFQQTTSRTYQRGLWFPDPYI